MGYIKPEVEVETAFFLDSNPIEVKKANSIIGEYLLEKNRLDITAGHVDVPKRIRLA